MALYATLDRAGGLDADQSAVIAFSSFPIELNSATALNLRHETSAPQSAASGKLFAVASMMDGTDRCGVLRE
jgi:hypothetical protein